ncbi:MAG: prolipoprotein diacylglyceryl transferase [Planctomycetota bacterium]
MKPVLFRFWFIVAHSYGLMLAVGFYAAWWLAARRARQRGESPDDIGNMVLIAILAGVGGSRILYFWQYRRPGEPFWHIIKVWEGGLVFYGGLIAAAIALGVYLRWRRANVWKIADVVAPSVAVGQGFGRLGCFLNGCCFGGLATDRFPLGMRFPVVLSEQGIAVGSPPFLQHAERGWISDAASHSLAVHPTQLYAALSLFAIAALVVVAEPHKRRHGELMALVVVLNALSRLGIELVRRDAEAVALGWTTGQWGALGVLGLGLGVLAWARRCGRQAWA